MIESHKTRSPNKLVEHVYLYLRSEQQSIPIARKKTRNLFMKAVVIVVFAWRDTLAKTITSSKYDTFLCQTLLIVPLLPKNHSFCLILAKKRSNAYHFRIIIWRSTMRVTSTHQRMVFETQYLYRTINTQHPKTTHTWLKFLIYVIWNVFLSNL